MMDRKVQLCPLKFTARSEEWPPGEAFDCERLECAWWDDRSKCCLVKSAARWVGEIGVALQAIFSVLEER